MLVFWGAFPIKEEGPDVSITAHVRYSRAFPSDPTINNFTKHLHPKANPMMDSWDDGVVVYLIERETYGKSWEIGIHIMHNGILIYMYPLGTWYMYLQITY